MDIKLHNGDCLELMNTIPDGSVDMVLCDLPYGYTACKWDVVIPFDKLWEQYHRVCKENAAIVLFASEPFTSMMIMSNLKESRKAATSFPVFAGSTNGDRVNERLLVPMPLY